MNETNPSHSLPDAVERLGASVVGIATRRHAGAGVPWREGVIVGSASVLWRSSQVAVVLPDGEQVRGDVRGIDPGTDLAAITFAGALPAVERATGRSRIGDFVFAMARDASGLLQASFGHVGAVAAEWRTWRGGRVEQLIRLDGGLYPGYAGAPVADQAGRVIGIASSAFSRHHGVVLPAATVDRVVDQLLTHGRVSQGYLGIAGQPVRATLDGSAVEGLLISSVAEGAPAARGGLLVGDVIVKVAGVAVGSLDALRAALKVGTQVAVTIARGGEAKELSLDVAERPRSRCG